MNSLSNCQFTRLYPRTHSSSLQCQLRPNASACSRKLLQSSRAAVYCSGTTRRQGLSGSNPDDGKKARKLTSIIQDAPLPQKLLSLLQQRTADLNDSHVSAAYTSAVKLCSRGVVSRQQSEAVQELLRHLHQLAERQRQQCGTRQLANIMWACGRLRYPATLRLLLPEFLQSSKLQQAKPKELSTTFWAAATLGVRLADSNLQQLVQHFLQVLPQAKPQDISNTLWAMATLRVQLALGDLQQLVQHFIHVLPQAKPQDIANTLWAASTLRMQLAEGDLRQLVQHFVQMLPQAKPQDISNTLLAAANLGPNVARTSA